MTRAQKLFWLVALMIGSGLCMMLKADLAFGQVVLGEAAAPAMPSDPTAFASIGWVLLALGGLFAALNQGAKFFDRWRDKPPAGDVRAELVDRFTERGVFENHIEKNDREHENMFARLGNMETGARDRMEALSKEWRGFVHSSLERLMESNDAGREKLHVRLNDFEGEIGQLKARTEIQTQLMAQLSTKIDRVIEHRMKT